MMEDEATTEPPAIKCASVPFDIAFHPSQDALAIAQVNGAVNVYVRVGARWGVGRLYAIGPLAVCRACSRALRCCCCCRG